MLRSTVLYSKITSKILSQQAWLDPHEYFFPESEPHKNDFCVNCTVPFIFLILSYNMQKTRR
jgi:hypothetical protein